MRLVRPDEIRGHDRYGRRSGTDPRADPARLAGEERRSVMPLPDARPEGSPVQTTTAPLLLPSTAHSPARRTPPRTASPALIVVRLLTALVGLATAAVTLGPRAWIVAGRSSTDQWLTVHPTSAGLVAALGGVEHAGNLLLFVPFATLLALSVRLRFLAIALILLACAPLAVEWTQQYLPGRVPDVGDIVRNTTGLLVAFVAVAALRITARLVSSGFRGY